MTSIQQRARDLIALAEKGSYASGVDALRYRDALSNDAPDIAAAFLRAVELLRRCRDIFGGNGIHPPSVDFRIVKDIDEELSK